MRDDLIDLGRAPHGGNPYLEGNFAPVAEERFDYIVSNPPFVITPRRVGVPTYEYRDGGPSAR